MYCTVNKWERIVMKELWVVLYKYMCIQVAINLFVSEFLHEQMKIISSLMHE